MKTLVKKICAAFLCIMLMFSMITACAETVGNDSPELNVNVSPDSVVDKGEGAGGGTGGDAGKTSPQTGDNSMDSAVLFLPVLSMIAVFVVKSTKKNPEKM